jgi:hypothetical protein
MWQSPECFVVPSLVRRVFAVWILTYGAIRFFSGLYFHELIKSRIGLGLAAFSYFIEATFFLQENFFSRMHSAKVFFVVFISFLFGIVFVFV